MSEISDQRGSTKLDFYFNGVSENELRVVIQNIFDTLRKCKEEGVISKDFIYLLAIRGFEWPEREEFFIEELRDAVGVYIPIIDDDEDQVDQDD